MQDVHIYTTVKFRYWRYKYAIDELPTQGDVYADYYAMPFDMVNELEKPALRFTESTTLIVYGFSGKDQKATEYTYKATASDLEKANTGQTMQMYMKLIQSGFTMRGLVHVVVRTIASVFATRGLLLYILHSIVFDVIQLRVKQSNKTSNIEYIYIYIYFL